MSTDEQMAAIGRLMTEMMEATKQNALLVAEIRSMADKVAASGWSLRATVTPRGVQECSNWLSQFVEAGGIDRYQALLDDFLANVKRIESAGDALKEAGFFGSSI